MASDLTEDGGVSRLILQTIQAYGQIDILVNNAGIFKPDRLVDANFSRVFEEVTAINEIAVLQVSQQAIPYLLKTNGTIVNIASTAAKYPVYLAF